MRDQGKKFWDKSPIDPVARIPTQESLSNPKKVVQWYVLQAPDGRYVGQQWSLSFRGARTVLASLQEASVLHPKWVAEARHRAMEALGVQTVPRPIQIDGNGPGSKIRVIKREDTD